jgi:hypothetical protein
MCLRDVTGTRTSGPHFWVCGEGDLESCVPLVCHARERRLPVRTFGCAARATWKVAFLWFAMRGNADFQSALLGVRQGRLGKSRSNAQLFVNTPLTDLPQFPLS